MIDKNRVLRRVSINGAGNLWGSFLFFWIPTTSKITEVIVESITHGLISNFNIYFLLLVPAPLSDIKTAPVFNQIPSSLKVWSLRKFPPFSYIQDFPNHLISFTCLDSVW